MYALLYRQARLQQPLSEMHGKRSHPGGYGYSRFCELYGWITNLLKPINISAPARDAPGNFGAMIRAARMQRGMTAAHSECGLAFRAA